MSYRSARDIVKYPTRMSNLDYSGKHTKAKIVLAQAGRLQVKLTLNKGDYTNIIDDKLKY